MIGLWQKREKVLAVCDRGRVMRQMGFFYLPFKKIIIDFILTQDRNKST